jgi:hypothetical protein
MVWLISLAYGAAVLVVATAFVFAIIWSVEKLAVEHSRREHARVHRLLDGPLGILRTRRVVHAIGRCSLAELNSTSAFSTTLQDHFGPDGV